MAESSVLPVRLKNWLDTSSMTFSDGVSASEIKNVVEVHKMKIEVDVIMPDGVKPMLVEVKIQRFLRDYKGLIDKQVQEALSRVIVYHRADQSDDEKAYGQAKSVLDKANKYVEDAMDDFRVELRKAVAKAIGGNVKAKDLQTIGRTSFKEMSIIRGAFKYEVNFDATGLTDLSAALKKKKWQHCAVVWKGEVARLTIDPKRKINEATVKELQEEMPEGKGQGAKHATGMIKASSTTKVEFEFLSKLPKKPKEKALRNALKDQTGGIVVVSSLTYPATYSSGADDTDETEEESKEGKKQAAPKKAAPKKKTPTPEPVQT